MRRTLATTVRSEWSRAWRRPAEVPLTVFGNALLVTAAWFLLPRSWLFEFTGPWGFPAALAGWMYADVSATNVLAQDPLDVLDKLTDTGALERLLWAKTVVLWILVAPVCVLVALAVGFVEHDLSLAAAVTAIICVAPFGALGLSTWVGVFLPYHQNPLRWRWDNRRRFRSVIVRWGVLVVLPYAVFPAAVVVVLLVPLLVVHVRLPINANSLTGDGLLGLVLTSTVVSLAIWFAALRGAATLTKRRSGRLEAYLTDPQRG
ncbi:hypothetical protein FK531_05465 [Rhodococcus spelaei]|uniref:Uncharacterized protein n=1 Tax=Rhodococcus spelaei TaxID=2546320 RepID=A0A541BP40_9NOCA|nr:hypothetical protein [Rhodococcus spelaei]TQF74101.1 hypothetical protein FK531_05465 [Rhodococcus spelaei]